MQTTSHYNLFIIHHAITIISMYNIISLMTLGSLLFIITMITYIIDPNLLIECKSITNDSLYSHNEFYSYKITKVLSYHYVILSEKCLTSNFWTIIYIGKEIAM